MKHIITYPNHLVKGLFRQLSLEQWWFFFIVMELQFKGHTTFIDEEDYHYLEDIGFYVKKERRANYLFNARKNIRFHRLIMNCPANKQVDHINGNGLDNRKANLRIVTNTENHQNQKKQKNTSSKYKGVYWFKKANKWMAQIQINGKKKYLGLFDIDQEAAKAYNYMAIKHFGEYARINEFD